MSNKTKFKYILISSTCTDDENPPDIKTGDSRHFNLFKKPLCFPHQHILKQIHDDNDRYDRQKK